MDASTRRCNKCGQVKPLTREYYYRSNTRRDGFQYKCIACNKAENKGRPSFLERLARGIVANPVTGCWEWQRGTNKGYGRLRRQGGATAGTIFTHRAVYELLRGPIPEGLVLDHLCRNPACCNPDHLEPVTNGENVMRGESFSPRNAAKTHCHRGHEFTSENTFIDSHGWRQCWTCERARRAASEARRRDKRNAARREKRRLAREGQA